MQVRTQDGQLRRAVSRRAPHAISRRGAGRRDTRCPSTVRTDVTRRSAISLLDKPAATSSMISRWRSVNGWSYRVSQRGRAQPATFVGQLCGQRCGVETALTLLASAERDARLSRDVGGRGDIAERAVVGRCCEQALPIAIRAAIRCGEQRHSQGEGSTTRPVRARAWHLRCHPIEPLPGGRPIRASAG